MKSNEKKSTQLGMPFGTASGKLRKTVIFNLLKIANLNSCYQCGKLIEQEKDLSIEHKIPYLDSENPVELFFSLDNIAFSHLFCNIAAARKTMPRAVCGTRSKYQNNHCRCEICIKAHNSSNKEWMRNKRLKDRNGSPLFISGSSQ